MSLNLRNIPFVLLNGIFSVFTVPIGWRFLQNIIDSEFAKTAYATMSAPMVAMLTSGILIGLIVAAVVFIFFPLFIGGDEQK